jgi:hypothetical protein
MSIYATNFIIDEEGKPVLIKHLNKIRVDRSSLFRVRGWNKTGVKARRKKINKQTYNQHSQIFNKYENN